MPEPEPISQDNEKLSQANLNIRSCRRTANTHIEDGHPTVYEGVFREDEAKRFVDNLFRGDTLKAAGTGPDKIMPAISRFGGGETARKRNAVFFPADPVSLKNTPDCFRRHRAGEPRDCLKIQFSYRLREWEAI